MDWRSIIAAIIAAAASACLVDVDFGSGEFHCSDMVCQPGFMCHEGKCVPTGSIVDAALPLDAAPGTDAPELPVVPAFGTPVVNAELSPAASSDDDEAFSADRLYVILNSSRNGNGDLWSSQRASIADAWPDLTLDTDLSTLDSETTAIVSDDALTVLFASNRAGGLGLQDVYVARRPSRAEAWAAPVLLSGGVNGPANDLASWISDDGGTIIIHSDRTGDYDIYLATGDPVTGIYEAPVAIAELNVVGATDASARFVRGGLVMTFHSDRPGGEGSDDLYTARRASLDEPFGEIRPIEGVNSELRESDAFLDEDLCYLALAKPDPNGISKIHEASCL